VPRRRLDAELVRRGLVATRSEAQAAVRDGLVVVRGAPAMKASTLVDPADPVELARPARRFVSRGGEKLDAAIERFELDVSGALALDAGASTGGFTDRLLLGGAAHVVALDVGYGQLAWSLREDARVTVLERTNVRDLTPAHLPYAPDVVVADLSFISLALAIPALAAVAAPRATYVLLVKPQFEAGREEVGRGGVVREPEAWRRSVIAVSDAARASGLEPLGTIASPAPGPAGNIEFLLYAAGRPGATFERGGDVAGLDVALYDGQRLAGPGEQP
jgi:23S rRNA (cytidine1920-2'-O)/16S rRNA (cytidine1409-2'-O)-methyltransferase